ncbi:MAG: SDR family NAD(P)-dependent oxidoreductase [Culturomica sp.]|jgi:short-subunit dehydrogenase|nr:SDR family NAD(P)-dependent oxidoreductase [Culturomica sp.]
MNGKRAIVVGATSGIGRGVAEVLSQNGYLVGITGRRSEKLAELQAQNPQAFRVKSFDVYDTDTVVQNLEELVAELGGLDLLLFNSGTGHRNPALDFDKEIEAIRVNVVGFTRVIDWAFAFFARQNSGHLASVSSIAGIRGNRFAPAYGATKAFQINYLESLRAKAGKEKRRMQITDIRPGFVDTAMAQGDNVFWVAPVEKAARQIYKALRSEKQIVYITKRWRYVALLMKILPKWLWNKI